MPDEPRRRCQFYGQVEAGRVGQRPLQGGAQIVEFGQIGRLPDWNRCGFQGLAGRREHFAKVARVALGQPVPLAAGQEPLPGIEPQRFQQPVSGRLGRLNGHQGFVDQPSQGARDRPTIHPRFRQDRHRRLQREAAGKHAKTAKDQALGFVEQADAPLDGVPQGLVTDIRGPHAGRQHLKARVQTGLQARQSEGWHARRRHLQGKGHAVEAPTDLRDDRCVRLRHLETPIGGQRPLGEERHGAIFRDV
jgi:hypothetical protein